MLLFDSLNLRAGFLWAPSEPLLPSVLPLFLGGGAVGCASHGRARRRRCCWCGMFQAVWKPSRPMAHLHPGKELVSQAKLPSVSETHAMEREHRCPHPPLEGEREGQGNSSVAYSCRKSHVCASSWLVTSPPLHLLLLWLWVACPESWSIPQRSWWWTGIDAAWGRRY